MDSEKPIHLEGILEKLARIVEDGNIIIDEQHKLVFFNEAAQRIFGWEIHEVIDLTWACRMCYGVDAGHPGSSRPRALSLLGQTFRKSV